MSKKGSELFNRLKVGPMKRLYKYYTPTAINLAGGVPMDRIFPFKEIGVQLPGGDMYHVKSGSNLHLNYNRGDGIPQLRDWIQNHVQVLHNPPREFQTCVTVGSTDAYAKIMMLFNGDTVVFDKFAYGTAVSTCNAFGRHSLGVEVWLIISYHRIFMETKFISMSYLFRWMNMECSRSHFESKYHVPVNVA